MVGTFSSGLTLSASAISDRTAEIHHRNQGSEFRIYFSPSALMILSFFFTYFMSHVGKTLNVCQKDNNFFLSWHCKLSATSHRLAIDQVLEIKDPNYS